MQSFKYIVTIDVTRVIFPSGSEIPQKRIFVESLGESFNHSNWVEADLPPESSPTALIAYTGDGEVKLHRVVASLWFDIDSM